MASLRQHCENRTPFAITANRYAPLNIAQSVRDLSYHLWRCDLPKRSIACAKPLVEIASIASRIYWLVRVCLAPASSSERLAGGPYLACDDALAARQYLDPTPPLKHHPQGLCQSGELVVAGDADDAVTGMVRWIHASGDIRIEKQGEAGSGFYYPAAAIRRAVEVHANFGFDVVPVSLRDANAVIERLHRRLGSLRGHKFAVGLRRRSDGKLGARRYAADLSPVRSTTASLPKYVASRSTKASTTAAAN